MAAVEKNDFQMPADFALFEGGPLHRLWRRFGFVTPWVASLDLRVILISMVAWLPLLVLSLWEGLALSGSKVPFLYDFQAQARFLIALPLFLVGERFADGVLTPTLGTFVERGIIREGDRARFNTILTSTARWNRSPVLLVFLLAFVLVAGHRIWQGSSIIRAVTWYGEPTDSGLRLTLAGYWYAWVAIPIFQFILFRWYLRLILLWSLLLRVSRLDLHLVATHPDHAGGIGFLGNKVYGFSPLLLGQGVNASGILSNRIFYEGGHLPDFWPEIAVAAAFAVILVLGPLTVFLRSLVLTKRQGRSEYNLLAHRYVAEFERKWIRGGAPAAEPLVGTPDIQSLADLANSSEIVQHMRSVPFSKETVLEVVVTFALPIAPLIFTMFSLEEILLKLLKMLL